MMDYQVGTLSFLIVLIVLIYIEKSYLKKVITPFIVTTIPFLVIIVIANFILIQIGFPPITIRVQYFILVQLLILWISGFILFKLFNFNKHMDSKHSKSFGEEFAYFDLILVIISWVVIFLTLNKMIGLFTKYGGSSYFAHPDFEKEMIKGVESHFINVGRVCFIFLAFIYKKSKFKLIVLFTLCGLFIAIFIIQVKYHILWLVLMLFFFFNMEKSFKKQFKNMTISVIIMLIVFNLFWVILALSLENRYGLTSEIISEYIINHTANYLFSAPMVLDNWLNNPGVKPDWTLFVVAKNIFNIVTANAVRFDNVVLVNLGFEKVTSELSSNVGTAYGVYFLVGGWPLTLAMSCLTSTLFYSVYYLSYKSYNFFLIFLNLIFLTLSTLTFFVQYFTSFSLYEMTIVFFIFGVLFKFVNFTRRIQ